MGNFAEKFKFRQSFPAPPEQNHENLRTKQNHRAVRTINNKTNCAYKTCANFIGIRASGF